MNKFKLHIFSPIVLLVAYMVVILIYAIIYSVIPDSLNKPLSFIESLYFSIVTITTLGYGDILPKTKTSMMIVSSEALTGVLLIGLFISSIWQSHTLKIEQQKNKEYISYYLNVIISIKDEYKDSMKEIAKISNLGDKIIFSNLKEIYYPSRNSRYGIGKSRILVYYQIEDKFINELQIIRLNLNLGPYPILRNLINSFFHIHYKLDNKDSLIQYETATLGDRPMKQVIYEEVERHQTVPEKPGLIANVINLYNGIDWKAECIRRMEIELQKIQDESEKT